jgi:hypothetical protein
MSNHIETNTGREKGKARIRDVSRYPFVPAIPGTLLDPDLVAKGKCDSQDRIYRIGSKGDSAVEGREESY